MTSRTNENAQVKISAFCQVPSREKCYFVKTTSITIGSKKIFQMRNRDFCLLTILALFIGCSVPKETTIIDRPIPLPPISIHDTVYVYQPVFLPSPCDTGAILELYCKGEAHGVTDGVNWAVLYRNARDENGKLRQEIQAMVDKPADTLMVRDTTTVYAPVIDEYSFFEKIGFAVCFIALGLLIGFVVPKLRG